MIKAVIFDCFGVLIADGLALYLQELEKTRPGSRAHISNIIRQNNAGLLHPNESNKIIAEYLGVPEAVWRQKVAAGEVRNEELLTWVKQLHGQFKTALLSNTGQGSLTRRFAAGELEAVFDKIVVSADIGMLKPDPDIYMYTADQLGLAPAECAYFDDRQHQVDGGRAAGMQAFLFTTVTQAKADLQAALADSKR